MLHILRTGGCPTRIPLARYLARAEQQRERAKKPKAAGAAGAQGAAGAAGGAGEEIAEAGEDVGKDALAAFGGEGPGWRYWRC